MPGKIYKIGEAAQLLGLKSYVLRFWESEFPQLNPTRTESGQRLYSEQDLELLRRIRNLLHERGLTIEGAKKVLGDLHDEGLDSELLDEGYQDFFMALDPEEASFETGRIWQAKQARLEGLEGPEGQERATLATRQAAQRLARHMAVSTGLVGTPRAGSEAALAAPAEAGELLADALDETLNELKELRALLASQPIKPQAK